LTHRKPTRSVNSRAWLAPPGSMPSCGLEPHAPSAVRTL
jgi:hypothetical protein